MCLFRGVSKPTEQNNGEDMKSVAGYTRYVPTRRRRLTDRTLVDLSEGRREMPPVLDNVKYWVWRLLEERKRYRRTIRRLARRRSER